jgi:hypothetical protein
MGYAHMSASTGVELAPGIQSLIIVRNLVYVHCVIDI